MRPIYGSFDTAGQCHGSPWSGAFLCAPAHVWWYIYQMHLDLLRPYKPLISSWLPLGMR